MWLNIPYTLDFKYGTRLHISFLWRLTVIHLRQQFFTCSLPCSWEPTPRPVESSLYQHSTLFNVAPCLPRSPKWSLFFRDEIILCIKSYVFYRQPYTRISFIVSLRMAVAADVLADSGFLHDRPVLLMDMTQGTACSIFFNLRPWWRWVIGFTPGETFPIVHWIGSWAVPGADRNALKTRKSLVSAGNYNTNPPSSASILVTYDEKECAKETVYRQAREVTGQYNIVLFTCMVQILLNNLCWGILLWLHAKYHRIKTFAFSARILHLFPASCMWKSLRNPVFVKRGHNIHIFKRIIVQRAKSSLFSRCRSFL